MRKKQSLLKWFGKYNEQPKKADSNFQRFTIKRRFHRGYYLESSAGDFNKWKARVNGKFITGNLEHIKKSIDWWCDMNIVLPPEKFATPESPKEIDNRKVNVHKGFKLFNDTGKHDEWYILYKGKLIKGSKEGIERMIDLAIKQHQQKMAMPNNVDN